MTQIKYPNTNSIPKTRPSISGGLHKFIYYTGLRYGSKIQRIYGLKINTYYYCEYFKDAKNLMLTFNRLPEGICR